MRTDDVPGAGPITLIGPDPSDIASECVLSTLNARETTLFASIGAGGTAGQAVSRRPAPVVLIAPE